MKWQYAAYVILGLLILTPSVIVYTDGGSNDVFYGLFAGSLLMLLGVLNYIFPEKSGLSDDRGKSRSVAQDISLIPGAGHLYLGKYRIGAVMFGLFLLSIILLSLSVFADSDTKVVLFAYSITLMVFSVLWSLIRICETSDDMDLEFETGLLRNFYVNHSKHYESVLMVITFTWLILLPVLFFCFGLIDDYLSIWIGLLIPTILPIYCFFRKRDSKVAVRLKV